MSEVRWKVQSDKNSKYTKDDWDVLRPATVLAVFARLVSNLGLQNENDWFWLLLRDVLNQNLPKKCDLHVKNVVCRKNGFVN